MELLMVLVILGILASVVVAAAMNMNHQTASGACKSDFKMVETAQQVFWGEVGGPATSIVELETPITVGGQSVGPWLKEDPGNASYYLIGIDDGTIVGGAKGNITVASINPVHAARDGSANCAYT